MSGRPPLIAGELSVLGEFRGLLFVDKPAGLQTEPDARHHDTLVTRIAKQLALPRARIHALSRLDTGVSGVVTLGLSSEARKLVLDWRRQGLFARRYVALATGEPAARAGTWRESIGRGTGNLRRVGGREPETAETQYAVVAQSKLSERAQPQALVLLALAPQTGRTHQLRVHAAAHGLPLLGDRGYGGSTRLIAATGSVRALERVALHAAWVELPLSEPLRFNADIPRELSDIWRDYGGEPAAFESALAAELAVAAGGFG
jgi:23S rRNA-/tRNA-specific pseudouridylate synthase